MGKGYDSGLFDTEEDFLSFPIEVHKGKQKKHIPTAKNYQEGKKLYFSNKEKNNIAVLYSHLNEIEEKEVLLRWKKW